MVVPNCLVKYFGMNNICSVVSLVKSYGFSIHFMSESYRSAKRGDLKLCRIVSYRAPRITITSKKNKTKKNRKTRKIAVTPLRVAVLGMKLISSYFTAVTAFS